ARSGAARHHRAVSRAQAPRRRIRTASACGLRGAADRPDDALPLQSPKLDRAVRKLRILVLTHPALVPPETREGHSEKEYSEWKTEYDVVTTLRKIGHDVRI